MQFLFVQLKKIFTPLIFEDEEKTRIAGLLNTILLSALGIVIIALVIGVVMSGGKRSNLGPVISFGVGSVVLLGGALYFTRRGFVQVISVLLVSLWMAIVSYGVLRFLGVRDPVLVHFFVIIALASLLLGGRGAAVFTGLSIAVVSVAYFAELFGVKKVELPPEVGLVNLIEPVIALGITGVLVHLSVREIRRALQGARENEQILIQQNEALWASQASLERRTRVLSVNLEVSRRLSTILDTSHLATAVLDQIRSSFNYYYVQIYLLDAGSQRLVLFGGTGEAGQTLLRRGHSLRLTDGLVGRAAYSQSVVLVPDVSKDKVWLPNPELPETKSEVAVPIIFGGEVLGVLDVQHNVVNGLSKSEVDLIEGIANQVAVIFRNTRMFAQTRESLRQAQKAQDLYARDAWNKFSAANPKTDFETYRSGTPSLAETSTPEVEAALQQEKTIQIENGSSAEEGLANMTAVATPLKFRNRVIGILGIRDEERDRKWTDEEIALIEAVSQQMSLALDNARLFEETSRRAGREKVIADMISRLWASGEIEQVMRTAVEQLGATLKASKVVIKLGTEDQLSP